MQKSISVIIHKNGEVTVTPSGYRGKRCKQATEFLEKALGMDDSKSRKLPEYYQGDGVAVRQKVRK